MPKSHRHIGVNKSAVGENIAEFAMGEATLDASIKRENLVTSRGRKYGAFTIAGTRLFVTERRTAKSFEIRGLPLEWRPFSGLIWADERTLMFDRWSQPHYGVHYAVNVESRLLIAAVPFRDKIYLEQQRRAKRPNSSYSGPNNHVMVVVRGGEFMMGSPLSERGRSRDEVQHRVSIPRTFAIGTTEVTNDQFARFLSAVPEYGTHWKTATIARFGDPPRFMTFSRTSDSPQVAVSWYDAARYCNWLSEVAGIPKDQWVYPEKIDSLNGLELPADYLRRTGYRLPTEAEWEYAARAGTKSAWHFGDDLNLLRRYAWYDANTNKERSYPVAQLLPNQRGLFDMLGNVWEWTFDRRQDYPTDTVVTKDVEDSVLRVSNDVARTRRGGSFAYEWFTTRSAHRGDTTYFPHQTRDNVGFRIARTMPNRRARS